MRRGKHTDYNTAYLVWFPLVLFDKHLLPAFQQEFHLVVSIHDNTNYRVDNPYLIDLNNVI